MLHELRRAGFQPDWQRVEAEPDYLAHLDPSLDVILADYSLPQFNAFRALQLLQERGLDIPFIVVTGSISEEVAVECMKQGAADYLLKDRLARLGPAVTRALEEKRLREKKRQAEEALRESEERFRGIAERSYDVIVTMDPQGFISYISPSVERISDFRVEEVMGKRFLNFVSEQDAPHAAQAFAEAMNKGLSVKDLQLELLRKDGTKILAEVNGSPIFSKGVVVGGQVIFRDITERKRAEEELQRRAQESAALYETTRDLAGQQDLTALLQTIVERATALLRAAVGTLTLYDAARGDLELVAAKEFPIPRGTRLKLGEGLAGRVAQTRQPLIVDDYSAWEHRLLELDMIPFTAALAVPMIYRGELIGTLGVREIGKPTRKFTEADAQLLSLFAGQAASAVRNTRLFEETMRRAQRQEALYRVSTALARLRSPQELCAAVVQAVQDTLSYRYLGIFLADPRTGDRVLQAQSGWDEAPKNWRLRPGEGLSEQALLTGELHYWPDVTREPRYVPGLPGLHSELDVPIKIGETVSGVLIVEDVPVDAFGPDDFEVLQAVANHLAVALENARLFAQTERRLQRLTALRAIDAAITASRDLHLTLGVLLDQITAQLRVDAADVLLLAPDKLTLTYAAGRGFRTDALRYTHLRLGDGLAGQAALERCTIAISDLRLRISDWEGEQSKIANLKSAIQSEDFIAYYGVPLMAKGQVKGVLEIFHRAPLDPDQEWLEFLETLAGQAAIAIDNACLFEELQEAQAQLAQAAKMTAVGELAAGVAHDINSPLTVILGYLELLMAEQETDPEKQKRERLVAMEQAGRRINQMARGLLDFSRREDYRFLPTDVNATIESILALIAHQIERGGRIRLVKEFAPDLPPVSASFRHLEQLWMNLLLNARDAVAGSPQGEIRVATRWDPSLTLPIDGEGRGGGQVQVVVSDNGVGIPPENLARLFQPFFTTKPPGQGTGLGLRIVQGILERHRGSIQVESKVGEGATFTVSLPAAPGSKN